MSEYSEILDRIEDVLEEKVRPNLALHGGNIRSLDCKDGVYRFQLTGQCAGCPSAMLTNEQIIQEEVCAAVPEVRQVAIIQQVSEELMAQARAILRGEGPGRG